MKNILIVKASDMDVSTSSNIRTLNLVKGLLENGNKIDLLCLKISENSFFKRELSTEENMSYISIENENKIYKSLKKDSKYRNIKEFILNISRFFYHSFFIYDHSYFSIKKIETLDIRNEYDIMISVSDPKTSHLLAKKVKNNYSKISRWIQYWGDPWAADINKGPVYPKQYLMYMEGKFLSEADKIVYVSPFTLKEQQSLFKSLKNKMFFLPVPAGPKICYSKLEKSTYNISYLGAYNKDYRNIFPLYNVINNCKELSLVIAGDGDAEIESTKNIQIYPRGDISDIEENTDLFICIINNKGFQIPSKLYYLSSTNRPVLVLLDGDNAKEIKRYLTQYNRFYFSNNNEAEIKDTIYKIIEENRTFDQVEEFKNETIAKNILE
ncbi:hypothetical protein [Enterococcus sp. DIV0213h]|uniref:hypothetical protein n=1 Tax=Enterococcus sp. DIV0213h TaxID=2774669 RepID=UPI003F286FC5